MFPNRRYWLLVSFIVLNVVACDMGEHWRDGRYMIAWMDTGDNMFFAYDYGGGGYVGLVEGDISGAGSDDFYVVVKRRRSDGEEYFFLAKESVDYAHGKISIIGPLNRTTYLVYRDELNLPDFTWSR